jgi:uncharacterized damage-inducible protein DinB
MEFTEDIVRLLVRELEGFQRELGLFPDDESVWRACDGVTNSVANLALHVAGNLQYFIGTIIGGTGYVRDREAEFGRRSGSRREVVAELANAIRTVREVLPRLTEEQLDAAMSHPLLPPGVPTRRFLLHLCVHAGYHLGQSGYLRRSIIGDARTSGAMGLAPLGG